MFIKIYLKDLIIKKDKTEKYIINNLLYKWYYFSILEKEKNYFKKLKRDQSLKKVFQEKENNEKKIKKEKLKQFIYKGIQSENIKIKNAFSEEKTNENILKRKKLLKNFINNIEKQKRILLLNNFLKYYFKILLQKKSEEKKIIQIPKLKKELIEKEKQKENENENENEKDNLKDEKTTITSNESPGYKLNMNTELARQKYLKDLFYNKIKERKEYLHKCFIKLYY